MDVVDDQADVVARSKLGVAELVDRRRPAQRARERVGEIGEMVGEGFERALVETDLRVGEVVVVRQDQVGLRFTDELGDGGARSDGVKLDVTSALQGTVDEVVQPDSDPVRSKRRPIRWRALLQSHRRVRAVLHF